MVLHMPILKNNAYTQKAQSCPILNAYVIFIDSEDLIHVYCVLGLFSLTGMPVVLTFHCSRFSVLEMTSLKAGIIILSWILYHLGILLLGPQLVDFKCLGLKAYSRRLWIIFPR